MPVVGVVGLGYVGLSSAVCFARKMDVVGVDAHSGKIESLRRGSSPIDEEGLEALLRSGLKTGRLRLTTRYEELKGAKFLFLTVGTPSLPNGGIDLSQVASATAALAPGIRESSDHKIVVVKSTVVPGTARNLVVKTLEDLTGKKQGRDFGVCSNPEFLREGSAIHDTLEPDRIVIGSEGRQSSRTLRAFYRRFYGARFPQVVETDLETAELAKYASNAFLATKISFINLMGRICEELGGSNIDDVARSMGLDPRIGGRFLDAGTGFGGSCFPKDVRALVAYAKGLGVDATLLGSVEAINETQPEHVLSLAEEELGGFRNKTIAVLGASFKTGTDDVRESRALKIADILVQRGAKTRIYDPRALEAARLVLGPKVEYCHSAQECIRGADLTIVVNAEPEFKRLKPGHFRRLMRHPAVLDTRRIYDSEEFKGKVPIFYVGRGAQTE